jgi:hypothetical protein
MLVDLRERRKVIEQARARGPVAAATDAVDPVVLASWKRSADSVDTTVDSAPVESADDTDQRWQDSVIRRAVPGLVSQLEHAATTSDLIALVTDTEGRVIWQSTPLSLRRGADRIGLVPGGVWGEPVMGTNGIGLALAANRPSVVFSAEHWADGVHDWVCYAAPVHGPDGTQVGALDLSTTWRHAHPLALATVSSMAQVVRHELRAHRALLPGSAAPVLEMRALGEPRAWLDGAPLHLTQRQFEILTILGVTGGATLGELHALLYGDRPVAPTTLKAEISHLRRQLEGHLASRPYRLNLPTRLDAVDLPRRLEAGDVENAARLYDGQLLPTSEAPFVVELRHELDVALRTALLRHGTAPATLRYTSVHPYDVELLERVGDIVPVDDPLLPALTARLAVARTT